MKKNEPAWKSLGDNMEAEEDMVEAGGKYRLDLSVKDSGCYGWQVAKIGVCEVGVTEASAQQMMSDICMVDEQAAGF